MKKSRSFPAHRRERERSPFSARLPVCAAALLAALAVRYFGPPEFYDALLYRLDAGPALGEIIEAFGQAPVSAEALERLWRSGVIEVFGRAP